MAFNWFRRQNESPETPSPQLPQVEGETTTASVPEPATTPDTTDLLAYAKAAYKNIQEKQAQAVETQPDTAQATTSVEDGLAVETGETVTETLEPVTQSVTEIVITENSDVPSLELPETTPTPLSFLERATAERQAKQERLIASSIDVSVPELAPPAIATDASETEVPELAFDDGFVWSTEILAAQGRRAEDVSVEEITWLKKLRQGLEKTRRSILNQLKAIVGQGHFKSSRRYRN